MSEHSSTSDLTGTVLAGRYRIVQKLGEGAMGTVYLGEHLKIGRRDAIKVLRDALSTDAEAIARFNRGARNVAAIRHPNVCTIYDYSDTADGTQFLAMQFVPGESLKDVLDREGALPLERAVAIAKQTADALEAAHEAGIIHRDLKPANIMISPGRGGADLVTVVDFDIAKGSQEGEESDVTRLGFVVGTPEYMSPEQLTGDRLDGRSDVYSLALVFFRMVTGSLPFAGQTTQDLMIQRLTHTPLRIDEVLPGSRLPEPLVAAVARALERRPQDRQASAAEFGSELVETIAGDQRRSGTDGSARRTGVGDPSPAAIPRTRISKQLPPADESGAGASQRSASLDAKRRLARPAALAAAGLGLVVLTAVGVFSLTGSGERAEMAIRPETVPPAEPLEDAQLGGGTTAGADGALESANDAVVTPPPEPVTLGAGSGSQGGPAPTAPDPTPAPPAPAPVGIRVPLDQVNATLWRQFEMLGPPEPSRAALSGIRDTVDAIWNLSAIPANDRAMAAYVAGSAWFALGNSAQCVTWLERALQVRPDGPGYRAMLDNCQSRDP